MALRQPVRVVLADDHDAFVEGLGMVLSAEDDLEIVALAGDGTSTIQAVQTHHPDVLVVDTEMPGPTVTELVRLVGQAEPATRVLLLAEDTHPRPTGPPGMSRAASARELAEAIRALAAGYRVIAAHPPTRRPAPAEAPEHEPADPPVRDPSVDLRVRTLSGREREILGLLANGWSNRRIADACHLSLNTVRTHVQNVLVKLGVHSKLEAAALAVGQGLVNVEDHPAWQYLPPSGVADGSSS